jgi:CRP-like cAMP-binding protein
MSDIGGFNLNVTRNGILKALSAPDKALIAPRLEPVTLQLGQSLFEPFESIKHVHFFEGGLSSEVAVASKSLEIGCIGHEGCSGAPVILGVDESPHRSFMQAGGPALRISATELRDLMTKSQTLQSVLLRYAYVFMVQIASTALANGRFNVEQRLARWILMSQDRLGDQLPLTHDFLAMTLGVRRSSVTDALHLLEGRRAINATRAKIIVIDRGMLETVAGEAYGVPEAEYRRLISPA